MRTQDVQLAVAEVRGHPAQDRGGAEQSEQYAEQCAEGAERGALGHQGGLQLPAGHAERAQQRERAAPPQHRERLRREHQECAGHQRHQREHVEVHAIGAGHGAQALEFPAGSEHQHARRQRAAQPRAHGRGIAAVDQTQIDSIQAPEGPQGPLRRGDVHEAERLGIGRTGEHGADPQGLELVAHDHRQPIPGLQAELGRCAPAEHDGVRAQQVEGDSAEIAEQRRLQRRCQEGIDPQHRQGVAPAGQGDPQLEDRTGDGDRGIARHAGEPVFREAFRRTTHD